MPNQRTRAKKNLKAKKEALKSSQNDANNNNATTSPATPSQQDSALHSDSIGPIAHIIPARETQDLVAGGNKVAEPVIEINSAEAMHVERVEQGSADKGSAVERAEKVLAVEGSAEKGSAEKDFAEKGWAQKGSVQKDSAEIVRDGTNGVKRAASSKSGEKEFVNLQPSKFESRQKQRVEGSSLAGNKGFSGKNSDQFQGYNGEEFRRGGGRQGDYQSGGRGRGGGGYGYRFQGGDDGGRIDALGRTLSSILRHNAVNLGLKVRSDGYVVVKDLLSLFKKTHAGLPLYSHSVDDLKEAVKRDNKQRFGLHEENGQLLIRANQGHSIMMIESEELLKPISSPEEVQVCVHGTYLKHLESIKKEGLKRMNRNHVHFAAGLYEDGVISGMRSDCQVYIYLNVQKALKDGLKLYRSENGVILAEGFDGVVPPEYFAKIDILKQKGKRNV